MKRWEKCVGDNCPGEPMVKARVRMERNPLEQNRLANSKSEFVPRFLYNLNLSLIFSLESYHHIAHRPLFLDGIRIDCISC